MNGLTYEATLAELTSLEEMMRTMMEDDQIHEDVRMKLWQVYSTYIHPHVTNSSLILPQVPTSNYRSNKDEARS